MMERIKEKVLLGALLAGMSALGACDQEDSNNEDESSAENTESACSDGIDNDGDDAVDCEDDQCEKFCSEVWEFPTEWADGTSPEEVGRLVAENFLPDPLGDTPLNYAQACAWYGALTVAKLLGDEDLLDQLIARFDPILTDEGADYISWEKNVDARIVGVVPLEIYMSNQDQGCYEIGIGLADAQFEDPQGSGIPGESRYWSDDMFMITGVQVQAFRASEDPVYRDRAALTMAKYLDSLQQDNGLFFHTKSSQVHWNRGNGWAAVGMAELLSSMTPEDEYYDRIMEGYTEMMAALLEHQAEEGIWGEVIDYEGAWLESSGSAMFAFAFITGVKNQWLDGETYGPAAVRAWNELVTNYLDEDGNLLDVVVGTGQGFDEAGEDIDAQIQFYLDRPTADGDYHGQAPIMWAAAALLR